MGLFQDWQGSRYVMQLFIIHLVAWVALLCNIALAQFDISAGATESSNFPDVALTCLGNLGVFFTCLVRGKLHAEMGVRDLLDTIKGPKLHEIGEFGLTTCRKICGANNAFVLNLRVAEVVMLSKHKPNRSMRQFMKYTSNVYGLPSIQLHLIPLIRSGQVAAEIRSCCNPNHACQCLVFNAVEDDIIIMLAERMPGTLKRLPDSQCLLPCLTCLRNGCHRCRQSLLYVEEEEADRFEMKKKRLTEGDPKEWHVAAVCEILDTFPEYISEDQCSCICIPTRPAENDEWTKMLISFLKTRDEQARRVVSLASDALRNYISQSGECDETEEYDTVSLIVPRLVEALINIILTGLLRVDGLSSALIARWAIRNYIVNGRGNGIAGNAFLTKSRVYSNVENTSVCQVLTFRGTLLSFGTFSVIITCINLLCSITWAVLIALEGGTGKWYERRAMPLSKPIVYVIMAAFGIDLCLICLDTIILLFKSINHGDRGCLPISSRNVTGVSLRTLIQNVLRALQTSIWIGFGDGVSLPTSGRSRDVHRLRDVRRNGVPHDALQSEICDGGVPHSGREDGYGFQTSIDWIWHNGMASIMMVVMVAFCGNFAFEIVCFVLGARGRLKVGRWFYGALQALVWLKWGMTILVFKDYSQEYNRYLVRRGIIRIDRLSYASTFLLNAIFVGVGEKWK